MTGDVFLGLDVGTQGTKGLLVDLEERAVVARASASYGLIGGLPPGAAEQHPKTWIDYRTLELRSDGSLLTEVVWVEKRLAGSSRSVSSAA